MSQDGISFSLYIKNEPNKNYQYQHFYQNIGNKGKRRIFSFARHVCVQQTSILRRIYISTYCLHCGIHLILSFLSFSFRLNQVSRNFLFLRLRFFTPIQTYGATGAITKPASQCQSKGKGS